MQRLLQLAAARGGAQEPPPAEPLAEPMAVDGEAGAAGAAGAAGTEEGMSEEEGQRYAPVTRSLFYLLSVLQDAEASGAWG